MESSIIKLLKSVDNKSAKSDIALALFRNSKNSKIIKEAKSIINDFVNIDIEELKSLTDSDYEIPSQEVDIIGVNLDE